MIPVQAVTLVTQGGTMMQLCDQRAAPYPSTGKGALVFNTGPHLIDPILENPTILGTIEGVAPIDSPIFTGDPQVPTPPPGDNDSSIPNTEWVNDAIDAAIDAIVFPPANPIGPAGGDLSGTYPDPLLKPSTVNGQIMTTVAGVSRWAAAPASNPGTVTSVSVVNANGLNGSVATATSTPAITLSTTVTGMLKGNGTAISAGVAGTDYVTPGGLPTSLPPNGAAGGDLSGTYPNPLLKPSVTNGQIMTTVGGVSTWAAAPASATLPAGSVGYGAAGNTLTGVLANMAFDVTNKRLGIGNATPAAAVDIVSTVNNGPIFNATGVANSSAAQNWFHIAVADPTGGSGSSFRIDGGTTGGLGLFDIDRGGDCNVSGWLRVLQQTATPAGGAYYHGLYIGNSVSGNVGLFAGTGTPTLDTFGAFGSLYMNKSSPGVPWYNNNGSTGWDRLVGESSTQTLSNKTITGGAVATSVGTTAPSSPVDGQLWYYSDAVNGGGALYIRYNDGNSTAWVPASPAATPGSLLQTVFTETGASVTGSTPMPLDDTIPQITEGDQYMTLSITPKSATSKLVIDVTFNGGLNQNDLYIIVALFQDATANALAAAAVTTSHFANVPNNIKFTHTMTSGTTSTTTFKVRAGPWNTGTVTFNGTSGTRMFGGVMASSIVIQEVA